MCGEAAGRCSSVHVRAASCRPPTNTSATAEALAAPAPATDAFCAVSIAVANASARPKGTCTSACKCATGSWVEVHLNARLHASKKSPQAASRLS